MRRNNLTYSVGRLLVNHFLIMMNGVGFMSILGIQAIMNSSISSNSVIRMVQ